MRLYPGAGHLLEPPCTPCNRVAPERSGLFNKEVITIQLPCPAPWPRSMQTRRLQAAAKIGPEFVRWLEEDGMLDWGGDPYGHAAAQRQSWDEVRSPPHLRRISAASPPHLLLQVRAFLDTRLRVSAARASSDLSAATPPRPAPPPAPPAPAAGRLSQLSAASEARGKLKLQSKL